mmetsp:Transcript_6215/g.19455  ORF Transcript_6215/g.19455 Transcript_6215/m.19455 type:complete len:144 (+) Transcript_6215:698-1129(+)
MASFCIMDVRGSLINWAFQHAATTAFGGPLATPVAGVGAVLSAMTGGLAPPVEADLGLRCIGEGGKATEPKAHQRQPFGLAPSLSVVLVTICYNLTCEFNSRVYAIRMAVPLESKRLALSCNGTNFIPMLVLHHQDLGSSLHL